MKNKFFTLLFLMVIAIGNVQAYDFMALSPSNHVLYYNVLDVENHTLSVTYPCLGGGGNYYYNYTKPEGDLIIPATINTGQHIWTVTEITDHAFYECQITSVEIPNTVKYIGSWAFYHTHIKHLTLPESVDAMGERVFVGSWLNTLTLPEKDIQYGNGCFAATKLTDVVIPEGVTVIPTDMFVNCGFLKHVSFPSTLTNIEHDAFAYCTALQEINIPSSVISIGVWDIGVYNPFRGTSSVVSISVDDGNPVYYSEGNCIISRDTRTIISGCKKSVIPNDVVEIGNHAFESGVSGALHLPASVTNIQEAAFYNCSGITKIYSFNSNPPSMYVENDIDHSFAHVSRTIPVYVPAGCVEAYRNAPGWNEFENIVENNYCWDGTVADSYDGGNGTPENPYQIATAEQLALLAYQTNNDIGGDAYYVLTEDISLVSCSGENIPWISIGIHEYENNNNALHCFTGHFDGGGHTIYGLYQNIENGLDYFGGLFGYTDNAEIKNVNMNYCSISGIGGHVGSVIGHAGRTDVFNCTAYDSYIRTTGGYTYAGGIVGYAGMPRGVSENDEHVYQISNCKIEAVIVESSEYAGGIVGNINEDTDYARYLVSNCSTNNVQYFHVEGFRVGGIVGGLNFGTVEGCVNNSIVYGTGWGGGLCVGGIGGSILSCGVISNSYNRGNVIAEYCYAGGIVGFSMGDIHNVYNTGDVSAIESGAYLGNIVGFIQKGHPHNCYWLENGLPGEGYPGGAPYMGISNSTSFHNGATPTNWVLNEALYGTTDLVEALNLGTYENYTWHEDIGFSNNGYPVFTYNEPNYPLLGSEWYYEITNDNGSITYQYLEMASDTIINDQPIHILVRINTLYDKDKTEVITHEYIYEHNDKVYWWNKTLGEFTTLYDFEAEEGDEWEIKVGIESITMHVDAVEQYEYEGRQFKLLRVSDDADIFSGDIVCGIGHLTSFFPEKLMNKDAGYRVENIRCYWQDGELVYQNGNQDCDEIYEQHHLSVDEIETETGFAIYPNPSHDVLFVKTCHGASLQSEYRITNTMGQTLMIGEITSENHQIDVSSLPEGMYFITIDSSTTKFLKE